jgi:hypothetical protein
LRVRLLCATALIALSALFAASFQQSAAASSQQPDFVFGGAEVTRWYNETHDPNITLETGRMAAHYLNGLVTRYLRALAIPYESNWDRVARCESGGNWSINTGNGYYGGVQFSLSTWHAYGGSGYPHQNSKRAQIIVAERVRTSSGLQHWPHCGGLWYG